MKLIHQIVIEISAAEYCLVQKSDKSMDLSTPSTLIIAQ